jgi:hypothetical protein
VATDHRCLCGQDADHVGERRAPWQSPADAEPPIESSASDGRTKRRCRACDLLTNRVAALPLALGRSVMARAWVPVDEDCPLPS